MNSDRAKDLSLKSQETNRTGHKVEEETEPPPPPRRYAKTLIIAMYFELSQSAFLDIFVFFAKWISLCRKISWIT